MGGEAALQEPSLSLRVAGLSLCHRFMTNHVSGIAKNEWRPTSESTRRMTLTSVSHLSMRSHSLIEESMRTHRQ